MSDQSQQEPPQNPTPPTAPAAPAPPPPPPPPPAPTPPAASDPKPGDVSSLPDWAQSMIAEARNDAGKARTTAKQQAAEEARTQLAQEIGKALGLVKGDEPVDPAVLQQTLGEREQRIQDQDRELKVRDVELATWRTAAKPEHNANAAALLDSRSFVADVVKLDPSADDFQAQLDAAVKRAVEANPAMRATPPTSPPSQAGIGVTSTVQPGGGRPGISTLRQGYAELGQQ